MLIEISWYPFDFNIYCHWHDCFKTCRTRHSPRGKKKSLKTKQNSILHAWWKPNFITTHRSKDDLYLTFHVWTSTRISKRQGCSSRIADLPRKMFPFLKKSSTSSTEIRGISIITSINYDQQRVSIAHQACTNSNFFLLVLSVMWFYENSF